MLLFAVQRHASVPQEHLRLMSRSMSCRTYGANATAASWNRACGWLFCILTTPLLAANWPAWRGPEGTGVAAEKNFPLHWSTNENVRWRAALPDRGNSTPVVWGRRIFIT